MGLFHKRDMNEMNEFLKKYISDDVLASGDDKKKNKTSIEEVVEEAIEENKKK